MAQLDLQDAFQLVDMLAGDSSEGTCIGRASRRAASLAGFHPDDQIREGPRMELAKRGGLSGERGAHPQTRGARGKSGHYDRVRIGPEVRGIGYLML